MIKRTALMVHILLVILIYSSSAFAQVRPGMMSITPYVGGFIFDNEQLFNNAPVYGLRLGYDFTRYFGLEASGNIINTRYDQPLAVDRGSNAYNYRMEGIVHLLPQYRWVPFLAAGFGGQSIDYPKAIQNTANWAADYGGGLKFFLTDWLALRADVRHIYVFDNAKKNIEYGIGLSFLFGGSKAAPGPPPLPPVYEPMGLSAKAMSESQINVLWQEVPGAAKYLIYRDGSYLISSTSPSLSDAGLNAGTQYCYAVTAVDKAAKESHRSTQACATTLTPAIPAIAAPADISASAVSESQNNVYWKEVVGARNYKIYRDGLYLTASKTPSLSDSGLKADTLYCYAVSAVDAAGKESEISKQACARTLLSMEEQKKTAEAAATASVQKEMLEKGRAAIDIEFDYDKAIVKPQYHKEIKKFADVMKANPDLQVAIEGHTDSIGSKGYNMKLSLKRAENVRDYMIKQFEVKASRLTSKGYGMSKPIAGNNTAEGRKKNRRVEAAVVYMIKK
jgi:OOP family OmpA-OmpF porin